MLEILQYICFAGLVLSGLAALAIADLRKKALTLFIILVFITILSFVFYAGIMLFIANIIFIFVYAIFYMLVRKIASAETTLARQRQKKRVALYIAGYAAAGLLCCGLGYIFINISRSHFPEVSLTKNIMITNMDDIAGIMFGTYSIAIIILAAAALMTFISFTVSERSKREKNGTR